MQTGTIVTTSLPQKTESESYVQRLWLVRHGVTPGNLELRLCGHTNQPLLETGRQQAALAARYFASRTLTTIYCSDLIRARDTALIIASQQAVAPTFIESSVWREISFGEWEGLRYTDIIKDIDKENFFTDPLQFVPPGGESLPEVATRMRQAFLALVDDAKRMHDQGVQGDLLLVAHGGSLRALLCELVGIPLQRQWQLRIDNASISAIDFIPNADNVVETVSLALLNHLPTFDEVREECS